MITNKHLGIILIIVGLVIASLTFMAKVKEDFYIETLIEAHDGVCILENDYCLHNDRNWVGYIIAWVLGASMILLGVYLCFFDKSYELFQKDRDHFTRELRKAKSKDEFGAYLAGFSQEEQLVLKAIREQDGIQQSTLRYRVGMSKTALSLLLRSLEERDVISRKQSGKTKKIFLRKKF